MAITTYKIDTGLGIARTTDAAIAEKYSRYTDMRVTAVTAREEVLEA